MNSHFPLKPTDIGLILSYQCQSRCAHCVYNCSADWKDWMTEGEVDSALDQLLTLGDHFQVHLTGGEPFLNFPLLLYAARAAADRGIPCYCETNGGWAVNETMAAERFGLMREVGMAYVLISISPFHLEYIAPIRSFTAINAAISTFGAEKVFVYQTQWLYFIRQFGDEQAVKLERYAQFYGDETLGTLLWQQYGLIPMGRAPYRLERYSQKQKADAFRGQNCRWELLYASHSHIDLYGNFIPNFCGGISLGNWHDLPALQAQYALETIPVLIRILVEKGPYGLYEMAAAKYGYEENEIGYAGACHLCVDVRRHLAEQGEFPELAPLDFYRGLEKS